MRSTLTLYVLFLCVCSAVFWGTYAARTQDSPLPCPSGPAWNEMPRARAPNTVHPVPIDRDVSDLPIPSWLAQADSPAPVPQNSHWMFSTGENVDAVTAHPGVTVRREGENIIGIEIDKRYRDVVTYLAF